MSGGSPGSTQSGPPEWAVPYFKEFMGRGQQVADIPYTPYSGQTVSQLNPYQTAGLDATAARALQGSPVNNLASSELQKTLGGDYLSQGNPYLTGMIDKAQGDVARNYNNVIRPQQDALAARSGSFGNTGVQSTINDQVRSFGDTLGNISTQMRGADYANERNRMQGAIGMAPSIANQDYVDARALSGAGDAYQAQDTRNLADQYARFQEAQNYPYKQLDVLGKSLGLGGNAGSTSTTTPPGANPYASAIGGATLGAQVGGPWGAAVGGAGGYLAGK